MNQKSGSVSINLVLLFSFASAWLQISEEICQL